MQRPRLLPALVALLACTFPACRSASVNPVVSSGADCRTPTAHGPAADPSPGVSWVFTEDSSERAPLDRWCAGVGPVVTSRLVDTATSGAGSLVVITWNTHVGGGDIRGLVRDLRAGRYSDGKPVNQFVLLLQEVYRAGAEVPQHAWAATPKGIYTQPLSHQRSDIVATARDLGLELYYVPSMGNGKPIGSALAEDRGNAILSTLPLKDLTAIELPYEGQRRVAAAATVNGVTTAGEPWELRVVSVHLDNRSRAPRFLQSLGPARTRQARALAKALGNEHPTILGGDLNTWSAGFMEGAVGVLQKVFPLHDEPAGPTLAVRWGIGSMRLDHLMFRLPPKTTAQTRRLDEARGSDHYPLIGSISFAE